MVPLHGRGKDLVAGTASLPTTRVHLSEGRENNFCQSHTSWLTRWDFLLRYGHRRAGAKSHSKQHSEEKNFTNRIFHGEQCRGLAIYSQLSSLCLRFDCK